MENTCLALRSKRGAVARNEEVSGMRVEIGHSELSDMVTGERLSEGREAGVWLLDHQELGPSQQTSSLLVTAYWDQRLGSRRVFPGSLLTAKLGPVSHIRLTQNAAETDCWSLVLGASSVCISLAKL